MADRPNFFCHKYGRQFYWVGSQHPGDLAQGERERWCTDLFNTSSAFNVLGVIQIECGEIKTDCCEVLIFLARRWRFSLHWNHSFL